MAGHVFHPGHHELHGVTVVLETSGGTTYVGRFHDVEGGVVRMHDVAVHDPAASDVGRDDFLRRTLKFGVRADRKFLTIPEGEVTRITPLGEVRL
ncbi:MAG TPA: hypothetical protein VNK43_00955 [Gemmatimonadales bacterium]|nr:hypothetical protein [Gemmatimonadales bacterium]